MIAMLDEASVRLTPLAALALTGDSGRGGDVLPRLNSWGRSFADTRRSTMAHPVLIRAIPAS
jgi:hypothetical protein